MLQWDFFYKNICRILTTAYVVLFLCREGMLLLVNVSFIGGSQMGLQVWDPFKEMESFANRFARSGDLVGGRKEAVLADWEPSVNISETKGAFDIEAQIPGVERKDVSVGIEEGVLTIKGERNHSSEENDKKFHRVEHSYGSFMRRFKLPEEVDSEKVDATFKNGMLHVVLPKTTEKPTKSIQVKINGE